MDRRLGASVCDRRAGPSTLSATACASVCKECLRLVVCTVCTGLFRTGPNLVSAVDMVVDAGTMRVRTICLRIMGEYSLCRTKHNDRRLSR